MKNFINNIAFYWDDEGRLLFTNVGFTKINNKKQDQEIYVFIEKLKKIVLKETIKINKLK